MPAHNLKGIRTMSTTSDRLQTAAFPEDYADILIETLAVTPVNFLSVKDALHHFRDLDDDQAAEAMQCIAERIDCATDNLIRKLLHQQRQVAISWCIEDVLGLRPDLTADQAWEVLEQAKDEHDGENGITWAVLEFHAEMLFGGAPETDEGGQP
jgi:Mg/Co/Ni transporter MgtE